MRVTTNRRGTVEKSKADLKKIIDEEHEKYKNKLGIPSDSNDVDGHIEEVKIDDYEPLVDGKITPRRKNILEDIEDDEEKEVLEREMFMSLPATRSNKRKDRSTKTRSLRKHEPQSIHLVVCKVCSKYE